MPRVALVVPARPQAPQPRAGDALVALAAPPEARGAAESKEVIQFQVLHRLALHPAGDGLDEHAGPIHRHVIALRPTHGRLLKQSRVGRVGIGHGPRLRDGLLHLQLRQIHRRRLSLAPLGGLAPREAALPGPRHDLLAVPDEPHAHAHHGLHLQAQELEPGDLQLEQAVLPRHALHLRAHGELDAHVLVHRQPHVVRQRAPRVRIRGRLGGWDDDLERASQVGGVHAAGILLDGDHSHVGGGGGGGLGGGDAHADAAAALDGGGGSAYSPPSHPDSPG
mmetsp:Transcript_15181/g.36763  ORF Transcript_15181/g.36763 Transcript_15181/m.36763 type:complete len:279 (-) Transcript_15181:156-992(-)